MSIHFWIGASTHAHVLLAQDKNLKLVSVTWNGLECNQRDRALYYMYPENSCGWITSPLRESGSDYEEPNSLYLDFMTSK